MNDQHFVNQLLSKQWKSVDTKTTRKIAHKCTKGVNFGACSKSEIFASLARKNYGITKDVKKFVFMMERASSEMTSLKEKHNARIAQMIIESISAFKEAEENEIKICDQCSDTYENCDCHEDDGTPIRHT